MTFNILWLLEMIFRNLAKVMRPNVQYQCAGHIGLCHLSQRHNISYFGSTNHICFTIKKFGKHKLMIRNNIYS